MSGDPGGSAEEIYFRKENDDEDEEMPSIDMESDSD